MMTSKVVVVSSTNVDNQNVVNDLRILSPLWSDRSDEFEEDEFVPY